MQERDHSGYCQCPKCYAYQLGRWIDALGARTQPGRWQLFATITYSTQSYPWCRGFPILPARPKADFAHHLFDRFVLHLEREVGSRIDYVVADQLGSVNGRFHQHAILAANGLDIYSRKEIWIWLKARAGWSRILPFDHGAAYYISRYIGRDANRSEWFPRVGEGQIQPANIVEIGKCTIAHSANLSRDYFKQSCKERKR